MNYTDENRGVIQHRERAKQIIDFSGIRYKNITPTDIDGFFEYHNRIFVFCEMKLVGAEMPDGQRMALERLVDNLDYAGKHAVAFVCEHNVEDAKKDVKAAETIAKNVYYHGRWHPSTFDETLKWWIDSFVNFAKGVL